MFPVGSIKMGLIAVAVLAVGLISWKTIQYIQEAENAKRQLEIIQQEQNTRRKVKDAVKNSPDTASDAIEFLRERQGRN